MNVIFLTYGDDKFETAKKKVIAEAKATGEFSMLIPCGKEHLSEELLKSEVYRVSRGGGLWSWKPDIIWKTMQFANDGDILVYCDSGCSLQKTKEWSRYWKVLLKYDIIAQRIYKRNGCWTRKEIIDYFDFDINWQMCYQYQATIILKVSDFTRKFISEWRSLMINHPEFVMDVSEEDKSKQHSSFIESRHDQSVYSALVYYYLKNPVTKGKIYTQWEHIEDYDVFSKQAIRATRLRQGERESSKLKFKRFIKRIIKSSIYKPFYFAPKQCYYSSKYIKG